MALSANRARRATASDVLVADEANATARWYERARWWLAAAVVVFGITAGYFVPYTVHGTDLVAARVSSMAPAKVPGK